MSDELAVSVIELRGNNYKMGLQQGKEILSTSLLHQMEFLKVMTANSNIQKAKEIMEKVSPHLLQELEGLADALDMPFDAVIKLYSGYDVAFPDMGCTAFSHDGFYVRNYDFSPELYDARLVFSNPTDGYLSVGFSQQVIGRLDGMNEKGLVVGLHFVNNTPSKEGFLATTIVRMLLEQCKDIAEASEFITAIPHGYYYNFSITDPSGKNVIVEASPEQQVINEVQSLICTNHFESTELHEKNRIDVTGSVKRKKYISSLLEEDISPLSAYRLFNDENSPLFFSNYKEYFGTLHTVVYSPKNLEIMVGIGGNSQPWVISMTDYIEGNLDIPKKLVGTIHQSI